MGTLTNLGGITEPQIPAAIARDTEVAEAVATKVSLVGNETIAGNKTFTGVLKVGASPGGNVLITKGGGGTSGFIGIFNSQNIRLGYIGHSNTHLMYEAEGSAKHLFTGNNVEISNATQSTSSTTGALVVNGGIGVGGFTALGDNVSIKTKLLTGVTAPAQGGITAINHGLVSTKIKGVQILVRDTANTAIPSGVTPAFFAGSEYTWWYQATTFHVQNHPTNSASILSKPFDVLITYIA